jgi:dethiobiotin synthetase
MRGVFIAGTDTGVGKTQVAAALLRHLHGLGLPVRARKPVESGCPPGPRGLLPQDAATLNRAAGGTEPVARVCPYALAAALSPERAAALEGRTLTLATLEAACREGVGPGERVLVEGAGGFYSPLAADGLNADLAARLGLPVLLVAEDRLGCINHTLLTLEAIASRGLTTLGIVLNRHAREAASGMDNAADLAHWQSLPVVTLPALDAPEPWRELPAERLAALLPG